LDLLLSALCQLAKDVHSTLQTASKLQQQPATEHATQYIVAMQEYLVNVVSYVCASPQLLDSWSVSEVHTFLILFPHCADILYSMLRLCTNHEQQPELQNLVHLLGQLYEQYTQSIKLLVQLKQFNALNEARHMMRILHQCCIILHSTTYFQTLLSVLYAFASTICSLGHQTVLLNRPTANNHAQLKPTHQDYSGLDMGLERVAERDKEEQKQVDPALSAFLEYYVEILQMIDIYSPSLEVTLSFDRMCATILHISEHVEACYHLCKESIVLCKQLLEVISTLAGPVLLEGMEKLGENVWDSRTACLETPMGRPEVSTSYVYSIWHFYRMCCFFCFA
jgi:hypothetical protein